MFGNDSMSVAYEMNDFESNKWLPESEKDVENYERPGRLDSARSEGNVQILNEIVLKVWAFDQHNFCMMNQMWQKCVKIDITHAQKYNQKCSQTSSDVT